MPGKEKHLCVWCGYPGATHTGGYRKPNGNIEEVYVCCEDHFDRWLRWKEMFSKVQEQSHLSAFPGSVPV